MPIPKTQQPLYCRTPYLFQFALQCLQLCRRAAAGLHQRLLVRVQHLRGPLLRRGFHRLQLGRVLRQQRRLRLLRALLQGRHLLRLRNNDAAVVV